MTATIPTPAALREAFDWVSTWADDVTGDGPAADLVIAEVRHLSRPALAQLLAAAGLEGVRSYDSKASMLTRLRNRLTARVRARERSEV